MFELEKTTILDRDIQTVFEIAESYPLFVSGYRDSQILNSTQFSQLVKINKRFFGFPFSWVGRAEKEKNKVIKWTQTSGPLKGLKATWLFQRIDEQMTRVKIVSQFEIKALLLSGFLETIVGCLFVKPTVEQILESLKISSQN